MIQPNKPSKGTIDRARRIEKRFKKAVREVQLHHKKLGLPIAVWKNDRVVWIPPEKI